ncbi:helix-turn-helix transcriptional regulator [Marinoscillum sp. MHG1-6]|uniref:ArsR/SmtB family transcription factor n=1 Tax=Marinoscillum sp. MHG1-6 TaxID=2959627 RepID=UPI0021576732|nr:metalloregulator ArsR/SmtB family transcription factor [Marinoscillum sp. MHG1-6]
MRRDVFQAIADPTRREIMSLLIDRPLNLNMLSEKFEMSRPAVSKHVKILEECGLVLINQQGRERYCVPQLEPLSEVAHWIEPFRKMWESRLDSLENYLNELQSKKKNS